MGQGLLGIIQHSRSLQPCFDMRWITLQYRGKVPPGAAVLPSPCGLKAPLHQRRNPFLLRCLCDLLLRQRSAFLPISQLDHYSYRRKQVVIGCMCQLCSDRTVCTVELYLKSWHMAKNP